MELLELMERLGRLKGVERKGWVLRGFSPAEDVAQHSFEVCSLSLLLSLELKGRVNLEKVLTMAVLHDWPEALTGDLLPSSPEKREREERALEEMVGDREWGRRIGELWREYREGKTLEAKVVQLADGLSVLLQCVRYGGGKVPEGLRDLWEEVGRRIRNLLRDLPEFSYLLSWMESRRVSDTSPGTPPFPPREDGEEPWRGDGGGGGRRVSP
ncbi:MAG: HD domain-containing protein [Candidatus Hadarchaeales archaeon]